MLFNDHYSSVQIVCCPGYLRNFNPFSHCDMRFDKALQKRNHIRDEHSDVEEVDAEEAAADDRMSAKGPHAMTTRRG